MEKISISAVMRALRIKTNIDDLMEDSGHLEMEINESLDEYTLDLVIDQVPSTGHYPLEELDKDLGIITIQGTLIKHAEELLQDYVEESEALKRAIGLPSGGKE